VARVPGALLNVLTMGPLQSNTEKGESDDREIRPPAEAYGAIGTIHDRVVRGGGNVGHVAHYGTANGNPLKRQ
jgi:hypothetical protein